MISDDDAARRAVFAFTDRFGAAPEGVWAAPGRVNVIGEHTDYNGGLALPIALPHTTRAAVGRRRDGRLVLRSVQYPDDRPELALDELTPGTPAGWGAYAAGVVAEFRNRAAGLGGLDILVDGDVPGGAGLSSSAALECAVALALRDLVAPDLQPADLVSLARRAENDYVGAPTGMLDQSASLLCQDGHALLLDTRDGSTEQLPLDLAGAGLTLLVIDTGTRHEHTSGGYGNRRDECEQAAVRLGVPTLREVDDPAALAALVDGSAEGDMLRRRARHVLTENLRVLEVAAILRGHADLRRIGPILTAGHESLRSDFEISTRLLDATVDASLEAGAHGARLVGGGFGGSVIALVDRDQIGRVRSAVDVRFEELGHAPPCTFVALPSPGARRIA